MHTWRQVKTKTCRKQNETFDGRCPGTPPPPHYKNQTREQCTGTHQEINGWRAAAMKKPTLGKQEGHPPNEPSNWTQARQQMQPTQQKQPKEAIQARQPRHPMQAKQAMQALPAPAMLLLLQCCCCNAAMMLLQCCNVAAMVLQCCCCCCNVAVAAAMLLLLPTCGI